MSERMLCIGQICEERGTRAMIARVTDISRSTVSRNVRDLKLLYPKRGQSIAAAVS